MNCDRREDHSRNSRQIAGDEEDSALGTIFLMKRIIDVINGSISQRDVQCLPCERVNLDYLRFSEYLDSDEHKAGDLFEHPNPHAGSIKVMTLPSDISSILRYFLDGSRRTYKIADLLVKGRYLPLVAGQVGVGVVFRDDDTDKMKPFRDVCRFENVIAFPDQVTSESDLDALSRRIGQETSHSLHLLRYAVKEDRDPVDLAVAKIMSHMANLELQAVNELSGRGLLQSNALLVKDGPLRYKNIRGRGFDITQFRNAVGLSKTFRPSFSVGKGRGKKDVGVITASLELGERTPVFKTLEEDKYIGMWYMRVRPREKMSNPLQGVLKIECYAIGEEEEKGLDAQRVNTISAHILRERNVTPFNQDHRWATHLYPIFQAESFIKSNFLSDLRFKAMF